MQLFSPAWNFHSNTIRNEMQAGHAHTHNFSSARRAVLMMMRREEREKHIFGGAGLRSRDAKKARDRLRFCVNGTRRVQPEAVLLVLAILGRLNVPEEASHGRVRRHRPLQLVRVPEHKNYNVRISCCRISLDRLT
jgi:hypothetical protein